MNDENLPIPYNEHLPVPVDKQELAKTEQDSSEPIKEKSKWEKVKSFVSNKEEQKQAWEKVKSFVSNEEVQKQAAKTTLGTVASIAGVKSVYDVPAYFKQRFMVHGVLGGKGVLGVGKGLEGSVEDILKVSSENRESAKKEKTPLLSYEMSSAIEAIPKDNQEVAMVADESPKSSEKDFKDYEELNIKKAFDDLKNRLALTEEGMQKGSEQRKLIAKLLRENREKEINSHEERSAIITEVLDDYTTTKVTGMKAARESLNSFCVYSGAFILRGVTYGIMDGLERYQKLSREERNKMKVEGAVKKNFKEIFKDTVVGGVKETLKEAVGKGKDEGGVKKSLKAVSAWGKIARYAGMGVMAGFNSGGFSHDIDKALNTLEGKQSLGDVKDNFLANLDRTTHAKIFSGQSVGSPAGHEVESLAKGTPPEGISTYSAAEAGKFVGESAIKPAGSDVESLTKGITPKDLGVQSAAEAGKLAMETAPAGSFAQTEAASAPESKEVIKSAEEIRVETERVPEAPKFIEENIEIKKRDSIWSVAKKYLEGNKEFKTLGGDDDNKAEALRTYNINTVKNVILTDPQTYGIPEGADINKLSIDQLKGIKWQEAFDSAFKEKTLTTELSGKQVENIVGNNKTLRDFFSEHPKAPRTQENYEAVLRGKGVTGETVVVPEKVEASIVEDKTEVKQGELKEETVIDEKVINAEAQARVDKRLDDISKWSVGPIKGTQGELLAGTLSEPAENVLAGNFGHTADNVADVNNLREFHQYALEAKESIGEPKEGETIQSYVERYETSLVKDAHVVDNELLQAGQKGADKIDYIPKDERIEILANHRNALKGLESQADKINFIKVIHYPKDTDALSKLIGGVNSNIFEGSPRAVVEEGDLIISFNVKDNTVNTELIVTKNGNMAIDGYGKNNWPPGGDVDNPTMKFNKQNLKEGMNFLNNGKFWDELDGKIKYEDVSAGAEDTTVIKGPALVVEEPTVVPEKQSAVADEGIPNSKKDVIVETIVKESANKDVIVESITNKYEASVEEQGVKYDENIAKQEKPITDNIELAKTTHAQMSDFNSNIFRSKNDGFSKLVDGIGYNNTSMSRIAADNILLDIMEKKHIPYMRGRLSEKDYSEYLDDLNNKHGNIFNKEALLNLRDKK